MLIRATLIVVAIHALACSGFGQSTDVVVVQLKEVFEPTSHIVKLEDIATILGGDLRSRRAVAELDIAEMEADRSVAVSRVQVEARILLAGFAPDRFHVVGTNTVLLRAWDGRTSDDRFLQVLHPEIVRQLGMHAADVKVTLARPLGKNVADIPDDAVMRPMLPSKVRIGTWNARIAIYENNDFSETIVVPIDVRVRKLVHVAARPLQRGEVILPEHVAQEYRFLDARLASVGQTDAVEGMELIRAVEEGQIVTRTDVRKPRVRPDDYVVRPRDLVEVIAQRRALRVRISGMVALQRGRIGDVIRVRHSDPRNDKVLTAEVVDSGLVRIRL